MKIHIVITASLLAVLLTAGPCQAGGKAWKKAQQRTFGFTGQVDAFNRGGGTLVVDDQVFHISESTRVHKRRGAKGTLSHIRPGTRIGFYPGPGGSAHINEIWILPRHRQIQSGYTVTPDE
jgi:hypothetical protein